MAEIKKFMKKLEWEPFVTAEEIDEVNDTITFPYFDLSRAPEAVVKAMEYISPDLTGITAVEAAEDDDGAYYIRADFSVGFKASSYEELMEFFNSCSVPDEQAE